MGRERINRCSVWAVWPRWCTTKGRRACFFGSLFTKNPNNVPFDFKKAKEGRCRRKRRRKDFFQTLRPPAEQARARPRSALSCYRWWWLKIKNKIYRKSDSPVCDLQPTPPSNVIASKRRRMVPQRRTRSLRRSLLLSLLRRTMSNFPPTSKRLPVPGARTFYPTSPCPLCAPYAPEY